MGNGSNSDSSDDGRVTVYNFFDLTAGFESAPLSRFKATRQTIQALHGGHVAEATAERVPASELDQAGRYRRVATGWGDLDPAPRG